MAEETVTRVDLPDSISHPGEYRLCTVKSCCELPGGKSVTPSLRPLAGTVVVPGSVLVSLVLESYISS